jgi:hypothetical protein
MAWGGWPRLPRDIAEKAGFSVAVLNITPVVLSIVVVMFAIATQLLAATGGISLSTTQQLTMWLVTLGLIVLLSIPYMACHAYLAAKMASSGAVNPKVQLGVLNRDSHSNLGTRNGGSRNVPTEGNEHRNQGARERGTTEMQTAGDGRTEPTDKAEQARCALAAAEEQLKKARAQADNAEQEAKSARARAEEAEQEAQSARAQAYEAEREAKVRLAEGMASKMSNWQKDKAT